MIIALTALTFVLLQTGVLIAVFAHARADARRLEAEVAELHAARDASLYTELLGRTVVVLTTEGQSYRGVLAGSYADGLRLVSPALIQSAEPAALGGEVFIERAKVMLIQISDASTAG